MIDLRLDEEADAVYVELSDEDYAFGEELDRERRIDYSAEGKPIGIELLCVTGGVDLHNLPEQKAVSRLLTKHGVKVLDP